MAKRQRSIKAFRYSNMLKLSRVFNNEFNLHRSDIDNQI